MDRRYLEPQLQAILSNLIAMNGGYDWVSDYLLRVAESGEESMDDREKAELKAVQGVMDLIAQLSEQPEYTDYAPDLLLYFRIVNKNGNPSAKTFKDAQEGINWAINTLSDAQKKDQTFTVQQVSEGHYRQYSNILHFGIPVEEKSEK